MSKTIKINASLRENAGKGAARAIRREKKVPAVIYGGNKEPVTITLEEKELVKTIRAGGFLTKITDIKVGSDTHKTLARDVQFHPVTDRPIHVDFLRVSEKTKISVPVHTSFTNEEKAPGIKRGGLLNIVRHELDVYCSATKIPEIIEIDLNGLEIGDSIHLHDVKLPSGVEFVVEDNITVCTVVAPTVSQAKEEESDAENSAESEDKE